MLCSSPPAAACRGTSYRTLQLKIQPQKFAGSCRPCVIACWGEAKCLREAAVWMGAKRQHQVQLLQNKPKFNQEQNVARAMRQLRMRGEERASGRVFYGQGNDFNNLSSENASALGSLDTILSSLPIVVREGRKKWETNRQLQSNREGDRRGHRGERSCNEPLRKTWPSQSKGHRPGGGPCREP